MSDETNSTEEAVYETTGEEGQIPQRVRLPRGREMIGVVDQRLGFGKMRVLCADRKLRICRIPGKFRRRLWVKTGDFVVMEPWEIQSDEKGDIVYKYTHFQALALQRKGLLKSLES